MSFQSSDSVSVNSEAWSEDTLPQSRREVYQLLSPSEELRAKSLYHWRRFRPYLLGSFLAVVTLLCVLLFGYIQYINSGLTRIANDSFDNMFVSIQYPQDPKIWDQDRQSFIRQTYPTAVHSHNDYLRKLPLFEALGSGCISLEADINLQNSDLFIAHTSGYTLQGQTLQTLYLEPLQRMLLEVNNNRTGDDWQGIYQHAPKQTIVLLVDHKTSDPETFDLLYRQLQPLRDLDYLTYWNGTERIIKPLTIVASGSVTFSAIKGLNETHRDIFWDAKLDMLSSPDDNFSTDPVQYYYNIANSYYASTEFRNAILFSNRNNSNMASSKPASRDKLLSQIQQAKARGLLSRYWDTPTSPQNLREVALRVLLEGEVDILNMDDLGLVRDRVKWSRWAQY